MSIDVPFTKENLEYYLKRFNKKDYPETFEEYEKMFREFDKVCIGHSISSKKLLPVMLLSTSR